MVVGAQAQRLDLLLLIRLRQAGLIDGSLAGFVMFLTVNVSPAFIGELVPVLNSSLVLLRP